MLLYFLAVAILGSVVLLLSTDQFVTGAGKIAEEMKVSPVLVGAVILGCGTGLPELALAFHRHRVSWSEILHINKANGVHSIGFFLFVLVLVVILSLPAIFPNRFPKHAPMMVFATVGFAAFLRGSLDRYEGMALIMGFLAGIVWLLSRQQKADEDPFAPLIEDDYIEHGAYIEAPVMTPLQLDTTRVLLGLIGTACGAQLLGVSIGRMVGHFGASELVASVVIATIASVIPHAVVAFQAVKHNDEKLALGNMVGSNLFQSLAIGGLVAIIQPYELGGSFAPKLLGVAAATAVLTYVLLSNEEDMPRSQAIALLASYVALVAFTVL